MFYVVWAVVASLLFIVAAAAFFILLDRFKTVLDKTAELLAENDAKWDQGMTELQEAHEAEQLDWIDQQKVYVEKIDILQGGLFDKEQVINYLRVELADVREAALAMQVTLDFHDSKCLPVLSEIRRKNIQDENIRRKNYTS